MSSDWTHFTEWWLAEVGLDSAYREEVLPLLLDILRPEPGDLYLDLGCGEGRAMRAVGQSGSRVIGCDVNFDLLKEARRAGPVVRCELPGLAWVRDGTFDGGFVSLVLEHLEDLDEFFAQVARVIRPGGRLAIVLNHPFFTAPESGPVVDPTDGELLWRWGRYLEPGSSREPAGGGSLIFYHRPLALLLNVAARAGWALAETQERGIGRGGDPLLAEQPHIPRLLGVRWTRESATSQQPTDSAIGQP